MTKRERETARRFLTYIVPKLLPGWDWELVLVPTLHRDDALAITTWDVRSKHFQITVPHSTRFSGKFVSTLGQTPRQNLQVILLHEVFHVVLARSEAETRAHWEIIAGDKLTESEKHKLNASIDATIELYIDDVASAVNGLLDDKAL